MSATVAKSVIDGTDALAAGLTVGTPAPDDDGLNVLVEVEAGLEGVTYALLCHGISSNGEQHEMAGSMLVTAEAA